MLTFSSVRAVVNLEGARILFNVGTTHADSNGLAAGTTGRELLFQATSEEMIEAYSHVPRCVARCQVHCLYSISLNLDPTGRYMRTRFSAQEFCYLSMRFWASTLNACFLTGCLDSTDFRQFEYYLNVSGLDVS